MNATDCARATEPYSTTARPKARLKLASRRRTCCGWAASANIGRSSPVRIIRTSSAAAVRIVTCGAPATARKLKSNGLPRPAPGSGSLGDTVFGSTLSRRQRGGVKQSRLISIGPARPIGGAMRFVGAGAMGCSAGLLFARLGSRRHLGRRQRRKPLDARRRDAPQRQDDFTAAENEERKRERNDVVEQAEQKHAGEHVFLVELP